MSESGQASNLVVIGSSAGGVEALTTLISSLAGDFPAPIVIAQHLDPRRVSHLAEILAPRTSLRVKTIEDHDRLEPGVIYLTPSNRHVEITDHTIILKDVVDGGSKPSIDRLLSTSAAVFQDHLIAVILTGMGSDGSSGAKDVKLQGGTVIIQDPETASFPSMPLSLAPTLVDIVAHLESIAGVLYDLLTGTYVIPERSEEGALQSFLDGFREQTGIDFGSYKQPTIVRRLQRRMTAVGATNLAEYQQVVNRSPQEYQKLISAFLIKVTEFFRDPDLFGYLRETLMPEIVAEAKSRRELRIWSAGCATGEEAYSLALIAMDLLRDDIEQMTVRIFATDLDPDAIVFARRGIYPESSLSDVPRDLRERYCHLDNGFYEIDKRVRGLVVFGQHDLAQRAPFPRIDLALCRNVLIYFTPELQKRAIDLFAFSLRDGGALVLGKAETVGPATDILALEHPKLKVYRRVGPRVVFSTSQLRPSRMSPTPRPPGERRVRAAFAEQSRTARLQPRLRSRSEAIELLLQRVPFGVIIVTREYAIQSVNREARRLLGIHGSAIGSDFLHLLRNVSLTTLRSRIDDAFKNSETESTISDEAIVLKNVDEREIEMHCYRETIDDHTGSVDVVVMTVFDVTESRQTLQSLHDANQLLLDEQTSLRQQIFNLTRSNNQLLDANNEIGIANLVLRTSNDELLFDQEEVQATTEEVETLNEEMQATNEELETLNEELQATVEELNTTNDDLEARTGELEELAISIESQRKSVDTERQQLAAILLAMEDAVLVVDRDRNIVSSNDAFTRVLGEAGTDDPIENESGARLSGDETPWAKAARGETFRMEYTQEKVKGKRRWFEAVGQPLRLNGEVEGGVVVVRDISERSIQRLQDQFMAIASHELRTPLASISGLVQLLLRQLRADKVGGRAEAYTVDALRQVSRMNALVGDLFDVSRLQNGTLVSLRNPVLLNALVARIGDEARVLATGQQINVEAGVDPIVVLGDEQRLMQVMMNLVVNVFSHASESPSLDISLTRDGATAEIQVRDYGPGIESEAMQNLFTRYFRVLRDETTPRAGLGLGLFISREIVTSQGGTLEAFSTPGEGSTFTIRLPIIEDGGR